MRPIREEVFFALGWIARRLPVFRGRTRTFLFLYQVLGLHKRHIRVVAELRKPVRYTAELDLHSWLARVAFLTDGYEPETVEFLNRVHGSLDRAGYVLDIGANIGLIAIPLAKLLKRESPEHEHRGARVVAFEAVPDNFSVLRRNLFLNDLESDVSVFEVALGECEKIVQIQVEGDLRPGEGTGTANILPDGSTYECVRIELKLQRLDDLMQSEGVRPGCTVVKIDTDGYDLKVLQGATRFLAENRPVIFGEFAAHCMRWHGQTLGDVIAFAAERGYVVWQRSKERLLFSTITDPNEFVQDLLLVPQEQAPALAWCLVKGFK